MSTEEEFDRNIQCYPMFYGVASISLTAFFFFNLNKFCVRFLSPFSLCKEEHWKWRNLLVSWCHAIIVSSWCILCYSWYPQIFVDLVDYHNLNLYLLVSFSTGYFLYDFLDIIINKQATKMWEVIPHHVMTGGMFFYSLAICKCIAYTSVLLFTEINTVFLHSRKLLQMQKISFTSSIYRLNSFLNLLSFIFCRFSTIGLAFYGIIAYREKVPLVYLILVIPCSLLMLALNVVLFWRLLQSDVLRSMKKVMKIEDPDGNFNNDVVKKEI